MKMKGKKKWLTLALAVALAVIEVVAPALTPLAELVADTVVPPAEDEPSAVDQWFEVRAAAAVRSAS